MASVGLSVNSEASKEAEGYVATSETLICELFPAIMETLQNEDEDVRAAPLPFLLAYANKLKSTKKRRGVLPEVNKSYYNSLVHLSLGRQDKCWQDCEETVLRENGQLLAPWEQQSMFDTYEAGYTWKNASMVV